MFQNVPKCSKMFQNIPKYSKIIQNKVKIELFASKIELKTAQNQPEMLFKNASNFPLCNVTRASFGS